MNALTTLRTHPKSSLSGLLAAIVILIFYIYELRFVSTDNAYVNADIQTIACQVSGAIEQLPVQNHQHVKRGDLLLKLDARPAELSVRQAAAELALARQQALELQARVHVSEAQLNLSRAQMEDAERSLKRTRQLVVRGFASTEDLDKAVTTLKTATASFESAAAELDEARITQGLLGDQHAEVQVALAALENAKLELSYTEIRALSDGQIINLSNRPGDVVQAGQALFMFINAESFWIDANFKETQISDIQLGQKADLQFDAYPGENFQGEVSYLSGGSGAAFSLLPPQNATGNWVKVTQRFPVKIKINHSSAARPMRVGMSADVRVHLRSEIKKRHGGNPKAAKHVMPKTQASSDE